MRKLIVSMNITLDGFMSGPDCELGWHLKYWTKEMGDALCVQLLKADTILLGKVTFNAMAKYWPLKLSDTSCTGADFAFANMMNSYSKIVFSNTGAIARWNNSRLANNEIENEIMHLKKQPGKDIVIYGSGKLVEFLMQKKLINEYQLWIHPVVLGQGNPFFRNPAQRLNLKHIGTKQFESGVILLKYKPVYS